MFLGHTNQNAEDTLNTTFFIENVAKPMINHYNELYNIPGCICNTNTHHFHMGIDILNQHGNAIKQNKARKCYEGAF